MGFRIGDLVREYVGGPLMRIIAFLDQRREAVCNVIGSAVLKRVAIGMLVLVGFGGELYEGARIEEVPGHPVAQQPFNAPTIATSGTIQTIPPWGIPPERHSGYMS